MGARCWNECGFFLCCRSRRAHQRTSPTHIGDQEPQREQCKELPPRSPGTQPQCVQMHHQSFFVGNNQSLVGHSPARISHLLLAFADDWLALKITQQKQHSLLTTVADSWFSPFCHDQSWPMSGQRVTNE